MPDNAVDHVARQVGVPPEDLGLYDWAGRQSKRHRVEIRQHLGFRECSVADADKLTAWLAEHVAQAERRPERVPEELLAHCYAERIEPPTAGRIDRMVTSALRQAEDVLSVRIASRLSTVATVRLEELAAAAPDDVGAEEEGQEAEGPALLALIKSDPGNVSLESMLAEIGKLEAVRAVGLPSDLFADVAPKVVAAWRARAAVEAPSHVRTHPEPLRLTLLAALLHAREREITDTLVDLLIATVHRINARAERKITEELIREFKRVTGKEAILFRIAEAAVDHPDDTVRAALFPVVPGGEGTLRDLVAEYKASGPTWRRSVQNHHAGLLHQPLSQGPDPPAGGPRLPLQQHHPPAGDRGACADRPARPRRQRPLLPARRARPGPQRDDRRLGGSGVAGRPARPPAGGPHGLRGRLLPGAAGAAALQGDLGRGRRPLAQPRPGPAGRFRGAPRRALPGAAQAAGSQPVHRRAALRAPPRAGAAQRHPPRACVAGRRRPAGWGDPADAAGGCG